MPRLAPPALEGRRLKLVWIGQRVMARRRATLRKRTGPAAAIDAGRRRTDRRRPPKAPPFVVDQPRPTRPKQRVVAPTEPMVSVGFLGPYSSLRQQHRPKKPRDERQASTAGSSELDPLSGRRREGAEPKIPQPLQRANTVPIGGRITQKSWAFVVKPTSHLKPAPKQGGQLASRP